MTAAPNPFRLLRAPLMALCLLAFAGSTSAQNGNIAINTTGAAAQPNALLDVTSITQGIFLPRMGSLPAPAGMPDGLTVYKTGASRGFYAIDNNVWVPLQAGNDGWDIFGNYLPNLLNPNPDFLGTTDSRPMYFRTNNLHRMKMDAATGFLGVGYPAATAALEQLDINGALRIFYLPSLGVEASNTNDPGAIRYQAYGTTTGTGQYTYGNKEKLATSPNSAAVNNAVLGTNYSYPLQYAGHWGNVDGTAMQQGTNTPLVKQPNINGWRAFENPYTELINKMGWSHFKEAICSAVPADADIANGQPLLWSNVGTIPAVEREYITPFMAYAPGVKWRRQYLFHADELNLELAQVAGINATMGLCPGEPITQIGFYVMPRNLRTISTPINNNFSVTVRNAPAGLTALNGFDNTPDFTPGGMSCGIYPGGWPTGTVGTPNWMMITINPPYVWDGTSNVLIEVAIEQTGSTPFTNSEVRCTQTTFNATYAASTNQTFYPIGPLPNPPASCYNSLNAKTLLVDNDPSPAYKSGSSQYRPVVRFHGNVANIGPGPYNTGGPGVSANYITYPGALVVEDTATAVTGVKLAWGHWRPAFPTGNSYWAYQGKGTISAQYGVYDNGSVLNDHVFDRAFDGRVAPGDAERFGGQRLLDIKEMAAFTSENRHLPTMKGRKAWNREGGFSLGDLGNQLWTTTETQALYIADLHDKLNVIEMLGNERPITAAEFQTAQLAVAGMPQYTDAEKARLIADLRKRAPLTPPSP